MDAFTPDMNAWPTKLVIRIGKKLRSDKKFTQEAIRKNNERNLDRRRKRAEKYGHTNLRRSGESYAVNELGERDYSVFSEASTLVDNRDHGDMMHRLAHHDSFDSLVDQTVIDSKRKPGYGSSYDLEEPFQISTLTRRHEQQFKALSADTWKLIASYLTPADAASLAITNKTLYEILGKETSAQLNVDANKHHKIAFLHHHDRHLPRHLLCFPCGKFHLRAQPGKETLKADYVHNPLFQCPSVRDTYLPRMRIAHGRELPYSFVSLAVRSAKHSHVHGIHSDSLSRKWDCKDSTWSHRTRYLVHDDRLLMRVVSKAYSPPHAEMTETSERHLLYDREEYMPFFSVCAHWRDGELMKLIKCGLSHVPSPPVSYVQQLKKAPKISRDAAHPNFIVRMCDECRPARRCPECPTEYLIEIQMVEDKSDPIRPFKHAIVVTRWSDLGNGSSPYASPEWVAINGKRTGAEDQTFESFSHVGRRAVGGIFESRISGSIPGQRMLSLNPKNKKLGEEGHGWY